MPLLLSDDESEDDLPVRLVIPADDCELIDDFEPLGSLPVCRPLTRCVVSMSI